jgi:hypothetical protein
VNSKLRAVNAGLPTIAEKTEPVGSIIDSINSDLAGVDNALRRVLAR